MARKTSFPVGPDEAKRLRLLQSSGFANATRIPELDALCEEAQSSFGSKFATISLLTEDLQILKARIGTEFDSTSRDVAFCNYTILSDDVFVVLDATKDDRFRDNPLTTGEAHIRFYAGAPLIYMQGIRLGAFCVVDTAPRDDFTQSERAELVEYAERASYILIRHLKATA